VLFRSRSTSPCPPISHPAATTSHPVPG